MLFSSLEFWLFFALVFVCQLALPRRARTALLLLASYAFYAAWDWRFVSLIWISTAVDYCVGRAIAASTSPPRRRRLVLVSLFVNLGFLGFFKYAGFFAEGLEALASGFGIELSSFTLDVILPVGISFYTFQTLSYTLDIYRGRLEPTRDPLDFALFVAFFPQLIAGPIERAAHLLPQIVAGRRAGWDRFASGCWLALWGLFKKVVVADNLAALVDSVYAVDAQPTGAEILLATYAFAFQIYCDFSGYTDIARGLARMLGFDLMRNFDLPYLATSVTDFWRRWHISLSTWLRDYLYVPLGGNRKGLGRTRINLMLTMLLGGLWHGAAWTFVAWGGYHGLLLVLHRALAPGLRRLGDGPVSKVLRVVSVFHLVCFGWIFFRAESLEQALGLIGVLLAGSWSLGLAGQWLVPLLALLLPLLAMQLAERLFRDPEVVLGWPYPTRVAVYLMVMLAILVQGEDGGAPFIYFQF